MISRRATRFALVQILYADIFVKWTEWSSIDLSFQDVNESLIIDQDFFLKLRQELHKHSTFLLAIIQELAPKFLIEKMPRIHIIILMIALTEMLYLDSFGLSEKISINEAIELAKVFSDRSGASFVNAILSSFLKKREELQSIELSSYQFFQ